MIMRPLLTGRYGAQLRAASLLLALISVRPLLAQSGYQSQTMMGWYQPSSHAVDSFNSVSLLEGAHNSSAYGYGYGYGYPYMLAQAPQTQPPQTQAPAAPAPQGQPAATPTTRQDDLLSLLGSASKSPMHGTFFSTQTFTFANPYLKIYADGEFPVFGRVEIAENNSAMPDDRVFFIYNHFNNASQTEVVDGAAGAAEARSINVDRYTVGFEKTLCGGRSSVELRLPLFGMPDSVFASGLSTTGMSLGNLTIISKMLVYESYTTAVAVGMGTSLPTGDDVTFLFGQDRFRIRNDAVHLAPYIAFLSAPSGPWFTQGALQVDIPTAGNRVDVREVPPGAGNVDLGKLNEQALVFVDFSTGYWWYRNPASMGITAVSSALELHYIGSLQDADTIADTALSTDFVFGNARNQFDVVHLTVGLDIELQNRLDLRVAGVFPLTNGDNRFFDSELRASINRRF